MNTNKKIILIIRDGWGYKKKNPIKDIFSKNTSINAIDKAKTPHTDYFEKNYPTMYLNAAGVYVGLPDDIVGNSEVGHMTIGAGRPILQSLPRINEEIKSGDFLQDKTILKSIQNIKKNDTQLHLIILMQDAGVHAHIDHLFETMKYCKKEGLKNDQVILHLITDGRDDNPESGVYFLAEVAEKMEKMRVGNVGTISGRYFSMDRNKNIDRTEKSFNAIFNAESTEKFSCGMEKIHSLYSENITDEFLVPMVKEGYEGVHKNDSIIFLNFRKDRAIQLSEMIDAKVSEMNLCFSTMTRYNKSLQSSVIFDNIKTENILGDILEKNNKKQLRISESEKYAHVTFFFDGGVQKTHAGKKEILIDSPNVATYDIQPEMSSAELTEKTLEQISTDSYDFIILNYPNADMVAHSGNIDSTVKAIEIVDACVDKVVERALKHDFTVMLAADHGNAEEVSEQMTSHTQNKIPFTIISKDLKNKKDYLKKGDFGLANITATIVDVLDLEKPSEWKESLIK
jgi:2,3-bisphosphoglycerate-independent phosphoglycerate mutase